MAAAGVTFSASTQCPTGQITINAPVIQCKVTSGPLAAGTITVTVGTVPTVINPTKTLAAGSSDQWKIAIQTTDAGGAPLDSGATAIATNESVQVQGTVQPYITFTIAGVPNGTLACTYDTTNPGAGNDSTATFVNLGYYQTHNITFLPKTYLLAPMPGLTSLLPPLPGSSGILAQAMLSPIILLMPAKMVCKATTVRFLRVLTLMERITHTLAFIRVQPVPHINQQLLPELGAPVE